MPVDASILRYYLHLLTPFKILINLFDLSDGEAKIPSDPNSLSNLDQVQKKKKKKKKKQAAKPACRILHSGTECIAYVGRPAYNTTMYM